MKLISSIGRESHLTLVSKSIDSMRFVYFRILKPATDGPGALPGERCGPQCGRPRPVSPAEHSTATNHTSIYAQLRTDFQCSWRLLNHAAQTSIVFPSNEIVRNRPSRRAPGRVMYRVFTVTFLHFSEDLIVSRLTASKYYHLSWVPHIWDTYSRPIQIAGQVLADFLHALCVMEQTQVPA